MYNQQKFLRLIINCYEDHIYIYIYIYIKNSSGPKIDFVLITSPLEFWPLVRLFDIYYPENFEKVSVSYQKHLLSSIYISNLHAQTLSKPIDTLKKS